MPKATPSTGTFSDLYDAMQQRVTSPRPPVAPRPSKTDIAKPPQTQKNPDEESLGGKEGKRQGGGEASLPIEREEGKPPEPFDINERAYRKGSFMLTNEEFWSLDEIKLDLQKRFDLMATKDDLARCAFRQLLADYKDLGEASFIVRTLQSKRRR